MKKLMLLLIAGILIFGCTQYGNGGTTPPPPTTNPVTNPVTNPATGGTGNSVTTHIQNFAFNPADISIKKGDTIAWVNDDSVPHQIKSVSGTFDSPTIAPGGSFQHTFSDAPGVYPYSCSIHPSMHGSITITS